MWQAWNFGLPSLQLGYCYTFSNQWWLLFPACEPLNGGIQRTRILFLVLTFNLKVVKCCLCYFTGIFQILAARFSRSRTFLLYASRCCDMRTWAFASLVQVICTRSTSKPWATKKNFALNHLKCSMSSKAGTRCVFTILWLAARTLKPEKCRMLVARFWNTVKFLVSDIGKSCFIFVVIIYLNISCCMVSSSTPECWACVCSGDLRKANLLTLPTGSVRALFGTELFWRQFRNWQAYVMKMGKSMDKTLMYIVIVN